MSPELLHYAAFPMPGAAGGNPAGVVLDARGLADEQMLALAAGVGYSESAFLTPDQSGGRAFGVRYFSPRAEVPFCGHATIASAVALAERLGPGPLDLHTPVGRVPVDTERLPSGDITATLTSVPTRTRPVGAEPLDAALAALRWRAEDLDPGYPPHVANAGVDHLVLAARTRGRLAQLDYDYDALDALMAQEVWTTVHLVWAESIDRFHVRDPFPPGGVVEDPATGAAAAAFGGYLRDLALIPAPSRLTLLQGEDMGRPSLLLVDIESDDRRVRVAGGARRLVPVN